MKTKTKKNNPAITIIWIAVVLIGAVGIGYSIRQIRWTLATTKNLSKSEPQVVEREPQIETEPEPKPEPEVEVEVVDAGPAVVEEPVQEEPEVESGQEVVDEPQRRPWRPGQNWGAVQQFFADLNLNEEEQARLRQGLALMRQQFESMSPEDQQAEMMRMAEIGRRWSNMNNQEREAVTQRMRERYEEWRRSDSIELPQLILD